MLFEFSGYLNYDFAQKIKLRSALSGEALKIKASLPFTSNLFLAGNFQVFGIPSQQRCEKTETFLLVI